MPACITLRDLPSAPAPSEQENLREREACFAARLEGVVGLAAAGGDGHRLVDVAAGGAGVCVCVRVYAYI